MRLISRGELLEKLERHDEFKLVMTLSAFAYEAKHIRGSAPLRDRSPTALDALDPDEEIVVYCADVHCSASIYAYHVLEQEGYKRRAPVRRRHRRLGGSRLRPRGRTVRSDQSGRTMQRKPMWLVEVSIASPWRAAGR